MPKPIRDGNALHMLSVHLKRKPHTIDEIQRVMDISERTSYRWLRYLEEEGHDVVSRKDFDGKNYYSIIT